jgi:methionine-rich copper-binding protein CopC
LARLRALALVVLGIVALLAVTAIPVSAHAFLQSSDPVANAVLPTAPSAVTLHFTEPLEPS